MSTKGPTLREMWAEEYAKGESARRSRAACDRFPLGSAVGGLVVVGVDYNRRVLTLAPSFPFAPGEDREASLAEVEEMAGKVAP